MLVLGSGYISVYHRFNDVEDKWIVTLDGSNYSDDKY